MLLQHPVKDIKELGFTWVIPFQAPNWQSKPAGYLSHVIGYEGAGSMIAVLKEKGLISGCCCGDGAWLEGSFSLLKVDFDLTDKSNGDPEALKEIGRHLFAFIAMLQASPPQQWIYEESKNLANINFKFAEDQQPSDLAPDMAVSLMKLPPSEALAGERLYYKYEPDLISQLAEMLQVSSVRVSHQAKSLEDQCTDKDTSYGSPMLFKAIDPTWLEAWHSAQKVANGEAAVKAAAELGMSMLKPNPFIPEDLSLKALPAENPALPVRIEVPVSAGGASPVSAIFHRQDDTFKLPKAEGVCQIWTPFVMSSVANYVKCELWCRCVTEALNVYAYDAEIAVLNNSFSL
jgi:insulysin